jgi:chromosome segregation ATPase
MNKLIPMAALAAVVFAGCNDNSREVEKLRSDLTAQQKQFDEANTRWASENDQLRAELNALKAKLGTLDAEGARPVAERIKELEEKLAAESAGDGTDPALAAKVDALTEKVDAVTSKVDAVDNRVTEVNAKVDAGNQMTDPEAAPEKNLDQAMARLEVSEAEKEQIRQSIIDAKKQILETLEVPTEDGRNMAEELIDTFIKIQDGDAKQTDAMALFLELGNKKIPGDIEGRTYAQAIDAIKARNKEDIGRILSPADQKKLTAAHADWTDFDVEGDPWGALYMERLQKHQESKK